MPWSRRSPKQSKRLARAPRTGIEFGSRPCSGTPPGAAPFGLAGATLGAPPAPVGPDPATHRLGSPEMREFKLSPDVEARLLAAAAELGYEDANGLLDQAVSQALDLPHIGWLDGGGELLVGAASSPIVRGVYFGSGTVEDGAGEADVTAQEVDRAEFESILRTNGFNADVRVRDFEVGRGAQGAPFTLLEVFGAIASVAAVASAPAVIINQWSQAAPKIREWLRRRRGKVTLGLVIDWCVEDAKLRVDDPGTVLRALASGHQGKAFTTAMDIEAVGPFCVTIQVPARATTFVYVTDEVGTTLHFHEVAGPTEDDVVLDEQPGVQTT